MISSELLRDVYGSLDTISLERRSESSIANNIKKKRSISIVHQVRSIKRTNIMITRGKFQLYLTSWRRLYGKEYLDDNVINLYIRLLLDNVHCLQSNKIHQQQIHLQQQYHQMTTFFYSCLLNPNITENRMKKMAWNGSLFKYNKIFIPINENYHWMLIIIEPKQRRIRCFNSLLSERL